MGVSRRALLKQTGAAIAALGLTDLATSAGIGRKAEAYAQSLGQVLGSSDGRKLALLIGIDSYRKGVLPPEQSKQLAGATTDVDLQRELLIHRFGFLPGDIVCLKNEQATRTGIYQAFASHLIDQAKSGDVVVVHFSGYGSQVRVDDEVGSQETLRSLVPHDGLLPTQSRPALNDILEIELKSLLKQLKTKKITTVIDAGFVDISAPLSGGLRSRYRTAIATGQRPDAFPLLASGRLAKPSDPFPGTLLRGAELDDSVIERQWNDFNAGAFTYVLTQYLWSASAPAMVKETLGRSQETLMRWGGSNQQPTLSGNRGLDILKSDKTRPIYGTPVVSDLQGQGVIQSINADRTATLWLGGLSPRSLEYLDNNTVFSCDGRRLNLRSHNGLTAKAKIVDVSSSDVLPLQAGQPVFESVRVLPKNISLIVALDSSLERIERVDATSALSGLAFVTSTSDTDLPADCLLAKPIVDRTETLTASLKPRKMSQANSPEENLDGVDMVGTTGYGLFSLTRSLIPGTLAIQEEAIKPAISRLTTKLRSLMALKMLRLSENSVSSQLPVRVTLEMVDPEERLVVSRQTLRPNQLNRKRAAVPASFTPEVPVGSRIRYRIFNDGDIPLYYTLINVDPRERLSAFCPVMGLSAQPTQSTPNEVSDEANSVIAAASIVPGSSVVVPSGDLNWSVEAPTGPVETYVVCSTSPLTNTFNTLLAAAANSGRQRVSPLPNPLEVVKALFSDINQGDNPDAYTLNVAQWATLNFTYRTV